MAASGHHPRRRPDSGSARRGSGSRATARRDVDPTANAERDRLIQAVRGAVHPAVVSAGCVLDAVDIVGAGRSMTIRVVVDVADDRSGSLEADEVAEVSRAVSKALDAADPVDGEYMLEVSTPGVSRPLTELRHWRRAVGRLVAVKLRDGEAFTARVVDVVEPDTVHLLDPAPRTIGIDSVTRARVEVEFTHLDDIDEEGS